MKNAKENINKDLPKELKRIAGKISSNINILKDCKDPQSIKSAKYKVENYVHTYLDLFYNGVHLNHISSDPEGISDGSFDDSKYISKMVKTYTKNAQANARAEGKKVSKLDFAKIKLAVINSVSTVKVKLANGAKWCYDSVTGAITFTYRFCKDVIHTIVDNAKKAWAWIREKINSFFSKEEAVAA